MAQVAGHLSVEDLEAGFRSARDPTAARHFQVIWLLARGHTIADVAAVTSFVPRWIEQLLACYNADGPAALGGLRRRNGGVPSVLRPELLAQLCERLTTPPSDGGLWTGPKGRPGWPANSGSLRIVHQPIRIVDVLISGQPSKHGLAKLRDQGVPAVLAGPGVGKDFSGELRQAKGMIEVPKGEQTGVGGDPRSVELQLEAMIKCDPESGCFCFTCRTVHVQPR